MSRTTYQPIKIYGTDGNAQRSGQLSYSEEASTLPEIKPRRHSSANTLGNDMWADASVVVPYERVWLYWELRGHKADDGDWIGLYEGVDIPQSIQHYLSSRMATGMARGKRSFVAPSSPGIYHFRYHVLGDIEAAVSAAITVRKQVQGRDDASIHVRDAISVVNETSSMAVKQDNVKQDNVKHRMLASRYASVANSHTGKQEAQQAGKIKVRTNGNSWGFAVYGSPAAGKKNTGWHTGKDSVKPDRLVSQEDRSSKQGRNAIKSTAASRYTSVANSPTGRQEYQQAGKLKVRTKGDGWGFAAYDHSKHRKMHDTV